MYTMPISGARAAAHVALIVNGVEPTPGENSCHVLPSICASNESPAGAQPKALTAPASNSWRGNPDSLTIQSPPCAPNVVLVENVIQPCRGRIGPVLNVY